MTEATHSTSSINKKPLCGFALTAFIASFFLPIPAIALGITALVRLKRRTNLRGKKYAIAALVISGAHLFILGFLYSREIKERQKEEIVFPLNRVSNRAAKSILQVRLEPGGYKWFGVQSELGIITLAHQAEGAKQGLLVVKAPTLNKSAGFREWVRLPGTDIIVIPGYLEGIPRLPLGKVESLTPYGAILRIGRRFALIVAPSLVKYEGEGIGPAGETLMVLDVGKDAVIAGRIGSPVLNAEVEIVGILIRGDKSGKGFAVTADTIKTKLSSTGLPVPHAR